MEAPRDVPSKARPVLSGRGCPLPASWSVRESNVYALVLRSAALWSPTQNAGLFESFRLFVRARESSVSGFALSCKLEALRSVHHVHVQVLVHVHPMVHAAFVGFLPARFDS